MILLFRFSDWTCAELSSLKDNQDEDISFVRSISFNWLLGLRHLHWKTQESHDETIVEDYVQGAALKGKF